MKAKILGLLFLCVAAVTPLHASLQLEQLKTYWANEPQQVPMLKTFELWQMEMRSKMRTLTLPPKQGIPVHCSARWLVPKPRRSDWAVICFGGSGQSLDMIVKAQGKFFADMGFVTVCIQNPPDDIARILLEMKWNWLGYSIYGANLELQKLRRFAPRILFSGFSLGTEPMMALGLLEGRPQDAYIYNDFLCRCKERLICLDREPNGLRNITPGYYEYFDFPEVCAALSDCPILLTEGGLDRSADVVRTFHPDKVTFLHQPKYANADRYTELALPRHLSTEDFFRLNNVDTANHNYKRDMVLEWMKSIGIPTDAPQAQN